MSWCKCPGVPRGQHPRMAADKCIRVGELSKGEIERVQSSDCSLWQSLPGEDTATFFFKLLTSVVFSVKFKFTTANTLRNRVFSAATAFIFDKIRF